MAAFDVAPATQADLDAGARLMAASFAEPMRPIFPDSTSASMISYRHSQLARFLAAQAQHTHPPTHFLVARDDDANAEEPLLGLVVWQVLHEPQVEGAQDAEEEGVLPRTEPLPEGTDEAAFTALKHEAQQALERCTQGRPVCYVPYLIVAPHAQRRGVGGALMARVLAQARRHGRMCYLDAAPTPSAEPFYTKLGFGAHGWLGSSVKLLAMTWET